MLIDLRKNHWQWLWLIGLAFIWGSSFILIKKGLQAYSPIQVAAYRMFFAALLLSPIALKNLKKLNRKNFIYVLEVAFIGNTIPAYFFSLSQTHINSSLAGLLNSITPIATLILGILFFKAKARWINIVGLAVGLLGTSLLIVSNDKGVEGDVKYALLAAVAGVMYAFNLNIIKRYLKELKGLELTALAFFLSLPVTSAFLLYEGFGPVQSPELAYSSLTFIFLLALFSSAIAVIGFNILIRYTSALFASSVTYIIPIFALMWGLLDGEQIGLLQIIALATIVLGVKLVNKSGES